MNCSDELIIVKNKKASEIEAGKVNEVIEINEEIKTINDNEDDQYVSHDYADDVIIKKLADTTVSEAEKIRLVSLYPDALQYVVNPTIEIKRAAIIFDPWNIASTEQTIELAKLALEQNVDVLPELDERTNPEILAYAVSLDPWAIRYCPNPAASYIMEQLRRDPFVISVIDPDDCTFEMYKYVLEQDYKYLDNIYDPSEAVCSVALNINHRAIKYIHSRSMRKRMIKKFNIDNTDESDEITDDEITDDESTNDESTDDETTEESTEDETTEDDTTSSEEYQTTTDAESTTDDE